MLDLRPVFFILGVLLTTLSGTMLIPALVDLADGHADWQVFVLSAGLTLFFAVSLILTTGRKAAQKGMQARQTFILTTLSWVLIPAFAAMPFRFAGINLTYIDGFFEAMSGLTTTGSTVIVGLDGLPRGILLWRQMLHAIGGVGIVVMGLAILPFLQVGGMQLFRAESSDKGEKVMPRAAQLSTAITMIFFGLCLVCAICFWLAGMTFFDAICHAFAAVATGGFSNYDASIGHFKSASIEWIATVFMLIGGLPFTAYILATRGRPEVLWKDEQIRWFVAIIVLAATALAGWRLMNEDIGLHQAVRSATFSVVSIVTTTGFGSEDFITWGGFSVIVFFILFYIGGCTGSTAGGVKVFRYVVLMGVMRRQTFQLVHPHGVHQATFNGSPVPAAVTNSVLGFLFLYGTTTFAVAGLLGLMGLDFMTAVSGAATAIGNIGPGLSAQIGPAGNFADLPQPAKLTLAVAMMLGRLELFTVFVIFTRTFWRA